MQMNCSNVDEIDSHLFKNRFHCVIFPHLFRFFPSDPFGMSEGCKEEKTNDSEPENEWWKYTVAK